ncbi:MAG TPA: hypothetical protein VHJ17_08530, partial [Thermomonospora sp.]|nr:hypothetical protein [Thermomonospora sp.]
MKRLALTVAAIVSLGVLPATGAAAETLPDTYVFPGDRAFPTGMALDPRTGHFYVGSADSGALFRGHVTRPEVQVWSPDGRDGRTVTSGMAVDPAGRLYVGGADTGTLRVYDTRSGALLATLRGVRDGFVNEIAVADDGTVYATDSFRPVVYRVTQDAGNWRMEPWLDVTRTPVEWVDGQHNLNGIRAIGRHLVTVNSNTGRVYRIDRDTRAVTEVDLGGHRLYNGDGLAWRDGRLHVVQGNINNVPGLVPQVAVVEMSGDLTRGRYTARYVPPGGFRHPSSIALGYGRVMVVNSQYNRWVAGLPPESLPFTMASIPLGDVATSGTPDPTP